MRKLIALVVVSALLYGGYWFIGRGQIESRLTQALTEVNAGPYDVTYSSLRTRGFPSRFDTTLQDIEISDPATGTRWQAPFFQLFALAYQPNEVIAVFAPEQTVEVAGQRYLLETNDMRASGKVRPSATLAFLNATVTMDNPRISTEAGPQLAMASVLAAMRLTPETVQTYDVFVEAQSIELPQDLRRTIDPDSLQPAFVQSLRFDSDIDLTAPLELNGPEGAPPQIARLSLRELALTWGDISVTAIGDVTPDAAGVLSGSISLTARNWQQALDLAVASGLVNPDRRFLISELANGLDETPDFPDTLTLTLTITEGNMSLGGYPLGPAPRLR